MKPKIQDKWNQEDYYVTCQIEERIIPLETLQRLQKELSEIKGFFFEIHGAVVSIE